MYITKCLHCMDQISIMLSRSKATTELLHSPSSLNLSIRILSLFLTTLVISKHLHPPAHVACQRMFTLSLGPLPHAKTKSVSVICHESQRGVPCQALFFRYEMANPTFCLFAAWVSFLFRYLNRSVSDNTRLTNSTGL